MKPRKPHGAAISTKFEKAGAIQKQSKREKERCRNKIASIAAQRDAAQGLADPVLRTAMLRKLLHEEAEERQRHKAKIEELERRAREVWK